MGRSGLGLNRFLLSFARYVEHSADAFRKGNHSVAPLARTATFFRTIDMPIICGTDGVV